MGLGAAVRIETSNHDETQDKRVAKIEEQCKLL
jgi:hypothetical protein